MKIAFVFTPFWEIEYPPLAPALLSAVLKSKGHEIITYDANRATYCQASALDKKVWAKHKIFDEAGVPLKYIDSKMNSMLRLVIDSNAQIICFTIYDTNKLIACEIAKLVKGRDRSKIIVFGGPGCYFAAKELIKDNSVDFVVQGEGEETLPELVDCIANGNDYSICKGIYFKKDGKIVCTGKRSEISNLDTLPFPDFSGNIKLYKFKKKIFLPIQASRGCINHCAFCNDTVYSKAYRTKSPERVINEMLYLRDRYNATQLVFHDSLINGNMKVLEKLCDLLIEEKLTNAVNMNKSKAKTSGKDMSWTGQAMIRPEMDLRILKKMRQAGCEYLQYGIESGSQKVLKKINKNLSIDKAVTVIKDTYKAGISCLVNIMFGLPFEEESDFQKTLDFLKIVKPYVSYTVTAKTYCFIAPGSDLERNPAKYGINCNHPMYWESYDGKNTYDVRAERYERYHQFARKSGILCDINGNVKDKYKSLLMANYTEYKINQKKNLIDVGSNDCKNTVRKYCA